jgi:sulfite exporter TauE/SafE
MLYLVAFLTGLAGSFHCIGMCGPIALALPIGGQTYHEAALSRLIYNLGRIITYSVLGAIFSIFGQAFILAGFQNYLTIAIGILLFLLVFFNQTDKFPKMVKSIYYIIYI